MTDDPAMTGVHRWRRFLIQLLEQRKPAPPAVDMTGVYRSQHAAHREHGDSTANLGRVVTRPAGPVIVAPRPPDISLEQATRVIPLLDRVRASLGMPEQEAVIYDDLASQWRALPGGDRTGGGHRG